MPVQSNFSGAYEAFVSACAVCRIVFRPACVGRPDPDTPRPASTRPGSGELVARGREFLDSGQSNHGSAVGGVTLVPGKVGTGFGFDGAGYVTIPHHPSLNNSNALTIELWYKSTQSNDVYYGILDKRTGAVGANYGINVAASVGLGVYYDDLTVQDGDDTRMRQQL